MKKLTSLGTHWLMLLITAVLFVVVAVLVDLRPVVDENFFFSTSDRLSHLATFPLVSDFERLGGRRLRGGEAHP